MKTLFKSKIEKSLNEKDVENVYRAELVKLIEDSNITSPYNCDGLLEAKDICSLIEFKFDEKLKQPLDRCKVLVQCLYYLKKFEESGVRLPSTILVGDINECFVIHTNTIVKYLSYDLDWKIAPSEASSKNSMLLEAMTKDENLTIYVFDVDDNFKLETAIQKVKEFSLNEVKKVRITKHNIVSIFDYFEKYVLVKSELTTNQKANLFIQIIVNPEDNCLHPKRKTILLSKSFGEVQVNQNTFKSFFSHYEGDLYTPKEKEQLTGLVDRLVEDSVRRNKGEFFTPTAFVDLAHKYISDVFGDNWKERFVVWDNSAGTLNLTRDYKFNELYVSTLEQCDIDTANQMGYNMEATKFQYDFLNDGDEKLPEGLRKAIESGKEILFLINPPYATAGNMGTKENDHKEGVADTKVGTEMKKENWGASSQNLYAQFLYKITKIQERNKNIKIAIFCPPLFLSGGSYKTFREKFFSNFGFEKGFLFEAYHFSDVAKGWGISFTIFDNKLNDNKFNLDLVEYNTNKELVKVGLKEIYNTDKFVSSTQWLKSFEQSKTKIFTMKSSLNIGNKEKYIISNSLCELIVHNNNCKSNNTQVYFLSNPSNNDNSQSVHVDNFHKAVSLFVARKSINTNWINQKDEYLAPNENHPEFEQFTFDSIVYSLFNNSSQQSSLRQVDYKSQKWDIKNEFFWLSKNDIQNLANENSYDNLYKDAKNSDERFVYTKLFKEGIYNKLSPDAKEVLDLATELLKKSIVMRKTVSENNPEYHLDSWDAGYAQLKLVWKEYFKEEFNQFRNKYKALEDRMRPLVYELGFLRK